MAGKNVIFGSKKPKSDSLLVSQDQYRVEQFLRGNGSEWGYRVAFKEDDIVEFPSVGCSIPIKDVYARVVFPPEEATDLEVKSA